MKNMLRKGRIRHLLDGRILESFEMKHVVLAFTVALGRKLEGDRSRNVCAAGRLSISSPVPGSCGRSAIRVAARLWAASGLVWSAASCGADDAEPPAALHSDPVTRPRSPRPVLVAIPGANGEVSCPSSQATNKPGRSLEKGAGKPRQLARGIANLLD